MFAPARAARRGRAPITPLFLHETICPYGIFLTRECSPRALRRSEGSRAGTPRRATARGRLPGSSHPRAPARPSLAASRRVFGVETERFRARLGRSSVPRDRPPEKWLPPRGPATRGRPSCSPRVGSPRGPAGGPAPRNGVAPRRAPSPSSPRSAPWWPCSSWCVLALSPGIPHLLDDPHPPSRPEHRALASPRDTPTRPTDSHPARLPQTLDPLPGHQGTPRDHLRTRRGAVPECRAHPR